MKFIDQAKIIVSSGTGGNGSRHFRREKHVPLGGPDGGDGGRGGDVVIQASARSRSLYNFHHKRRFHAKDGAPGAESRSSGKSAPALVLKVPPGTAVHDDETGELIADLVSDGDRVVVAEGGNGGWGNWHFKTSTRQAPDKANPGLPGVTRTLRLELHLLADVALVGLPNAGKSTLIRAVSASKAEVADYPFTTLVPNLGVVRHRGRIFTVADVPGLIEGAAEGAGLGHRFLRHVERCAVMTYVLDPTAIEPLEQQLTTLRGELGRFDPELAARPSIIIVNKSDVAGDLLPALLDDLRPRVGRSPLCGMSGAARQGLDAWLDAVLDMLPGAEPEIADGPWHPLDEA
ncbi:MAG: GTPase ObgE [Deltaproteobacteria bacterium]|nr:GTPase ObgE [Deltaproteobacteria bacterium]